MTTQPMPVKNRDIHFETRLQPSQSASGRGIKILGIWLCCVFIMTSIIFATVGAWPVSGFLGLDLILLCLALWLHWKKSRIFERIIICGHTLFLERVSPWGKQQRWSFSTAWLQILIDGPDHHHLALRSHGTTVTFGNFLTPQERAKVAAQLKQALQQPA